MTALKPCTLIGSDKGGVGKSLLAQLIVLAHDYGKVPLKVVEIDHQRKLSHVFGSRVDLAIDGSASIDDSLKDRRALESYFNPCYAVWSSGASLTDLGANVTTPLLAWMRHIDFADVAQEDGLVIRFVAVASPDDQSLRSALSSLKAARSVLGTRGELFLVLNDTNGLSGFTPYKGLDLWKDLTAACIELHVHVTEIPFCDSAIMEWGRAHGRTILDMLKNIDGALEDVQRDAHLDRLALRIHVRRFREWVEAVQASLAPLFEEPRYLQAAE